jgi:signal transduction histidine kinase
MHGFLADWADEQQFELEKKGVSFDSDIRLEQEVEVLIDRDKFKRVLTNVIENSVKYMDKENKRIGLLAFAEGEAIRIEIVDNGQGIESAALPHIFERFYRAEESRNVRTGGSGLGLAIARQIMEGHSGEIVAESSKGEGTTIKLAFPILR